MDNISLITSPDSFTKLCKALFATEFEDFQTIDDSGGDGGNDGYSEEKKMLFQFYCPEKPQKITSSGYKSKIRSDLIKAEKLSKSGQYIIEKWVFVTPSELREEIQTYIRSESRKKGFRGIAWSSPKLTSLLSKHPYLRSQFPDLIQPDIERELEHRMHELKESLSFLDRKYGENVQSADVAKLNQVSELEFNFSSDQEFLIVKINQVHLLNNQSYDYRNDYGSAMQHIKGMQKDWFVTAAVFMTNAIPDGGPDKLFRCFDENINPASKNALDEYKSRLNTFLKNLHSLRHGNKSGELQKDFLTLDERRMGITEIPAERLIPLFKNFENDLLLLFQNFKLKISL